MGVFVCFFSVLDLWKKRKKFTWWSGYRFKTFRGR